VGLRDKLKRLEREARGEMIEIPQKDGPSARFPASTLKDAYLNLMERLGAGEDAPPEHPLVVAVRNTSDPEWQQSVYMCEDPDEHTKPIPNLSEP
jgi:hypothetical protein